MRVQLPYVSIVETHDGLTKNTLNDVLHRAHEWSRGRSCFLELRDAAEQRFLFFKDGQIYASGRAVDQQLSDSNIRDFLLVAGHMHFPELVWYELNNRILHSILILTQKKPVLRVQSSLVDLDELLDKIESEGKSCVVAASRDGFLAALRYEKGTACALCHEASMDRPREASFREEFLVKIYTLAAEEQLTINLYEDLLVSYARDAKTIPDDFEGRFEELYLSKPPVLSLRFKDKELDHWAFDRAQFKIGRTPDNDIVVDNLGVSRLHAVIEEEKGNYYVRDCDSLNGTLLNGKKVGRARLENGDEISIGKHTILFRRQGGQAMPAEETIQGFDQTMIIQRDAASVEMPAPAESRRSHKPRLIMRTEFGDRVIEIDKDRLVIGKDDLADIAIGGVFVAKRHAEIVLDEGRVVIRHLSGLRKVTVGGKSVREKELSDNDEIKIAKEAFVFQE